MQSTQLVQAMFMASLAHRDQRRKGLIQAPYVNHPIDVANILTSAGVTDVNILSAALLHDTIEDTCVTYGLIVDNFGAEVADLVMEVTDDESLPKIIRKKLQIENCNKYSDGAILIRLADKLSNLIDLKNDIPPEWSEDRLNGYFVWSYIIWKRLKGKNEYLDSKLEEFFESVGLIDVSDEELQDRLEAYLLLV